MSDQLTVQVAPPRGTFQARCDEKGRLKLPANFQRFLDRLDEKVVFCTTLDKRIARIYPISIWKQNELFFQGFQTNPRAAADVALIANHYGADSEVDGQGRILLPALLRRELKLENETVWLDHFRGRFNVYSDALYQERLGQATESLTDKLDVLEQGGLL
jgi:MraZ protein